MGNREVKSLSQCYTASEWQNWLQFLCSQSLCQTAPYGTTQESLQFTIGTSSGRLHPWRVLLKIKALQEAQVQKGIAANGLCDGSRRWKGCCRRICECRGRGLSGEWEGVQKARECGNFYHCWMIHINTCFRNGDWFLISADKTSRLNHFHQFLACTECSSGFYL